MTGGYNKEYIIRVLNIIIKMELETKEGDRISLGSSKMNEC